MQPITISLDAETHKLAKEKTNFSSWVRGQLRSERNQRPTREIIKGLEEQVELLSKQSDLFYDLLMEEREKSSTSGDEEA